MLNKDFMSKFLSIQDTDFLLLMILDSNPIGTSYLLCMILKKKKSSYSIQLLLFNMINRTLQLKHFNRLSF